HVIETNAAAVKAATSQPKPTPRVVREMPADRTRHTDEEVARFSAQRFRFPGVEVQARLFRQYPLGETASHVIGFIGRVSRSEAKAIEDTDDAANYRGTDHIGKEGLEKSYEKQLHGVTGYEEVE
ncbi:MAG: hypothetical protein V4641_26590, partial [Pseudomonadota bacterium]